MFTFKNTKKVTDNELIALYKDTGDNCYVGELYKRYSHLVFCICMKYLKNEDDSKDAVMQIFEKLFDDLKKYKVEYFKGWLHTTARNHCLLKLRADQSVFNKTEEFKKDSFEFMDFSLPFNLNEDNSDENYLNYLNSAIEQLNEDQKKCINMFYLEGKSYVEIMKEGTYSLNQVKSYIQNGKRNLKIYIQSKHEQKIK